MPSRIRRSVATLGLSGWLRVAALAVGLGIPSLVTWTLDRQYSQDLAYAEKRAANTARALGQHATRSFETIDTYLRAVVSLVGPRADTLPSQALHAALHEQFVHSHLNNIIIIDRDGRAIVEADTFPSRSLDVHDRDYFQALRDRPDEDLVIGRPVIGRLTGKLLLPVARRIDNPNGSFAGIVQAMLDLETFQTVYADIDNGPGATLNLWHADGTLLVRSPRMPELVGKNYADRTNYREHVLSRDDKPFWSPGLTDGVVRVIAYSFLDGFPLYVGAALSRADALADWRRSALTQGAVAGSLTIVLVVALLLLAREIEQRQTADAQTRASEARLRALTDTLPQMVWSMDGEAGATVYRNAQFEAYYGPMGPTLADRLAAHHPDDAGGMAETRTATIEKSLTYSVEGRLRRHDGCYRWHRLVMIPVRRDGEVVEWIGTALDIDDIVVARKEQAETAALLRATLETMDEGLILYGPDLRVRLHNRRARELLDLPETVLHEGSPYSAINAFQVARGEYRTSPNTLEGALVAADLASLPDVFERQRPDGTSLEVRVVRLQGGGYLRTYIDTTRRREAEARLRMSEERLALALDSGEDGIWDWDLAAGEIWVSDQWMHRLGDGGCQRIAMSAYAQFVHPEDRERMARALREHLKGLTLAFTCEHRLCRRDGDYFWVLTRGRVVERAATGHATRMVGTQIDISRRKEAEARVEHMAYHDALTGLSNRLLFRERLDCAIRATATAPGRFAVLVCDLDGFKAVNDTLGHMVGDRLLCVVAARMRAVLNEGDIAARLGGDEFALVLGGLDGESSARRVAERIIAAVSAPVEIDQARVEVGISIGYAMVPQGGGDADEVFKHADAALYEAKAAGRGICRLFRPNVHRRAAVRGSLALDMKEAIRRGDFSLVYQPVIDVTTKAVVSFEALMRWDHPERGAISPADFIPVAEETGLIVPLGAWALDRACREAQRWPAPIRVAVNVSTVQIRDGLEEAVMTALAGSGLDARRLTLEVTESVLMRDADDALTRLHRLRGLGAEVALDDFGTGFSSLSYLRRFPFDKIKLDRAFVRDIAEPETAAIVRAVADLGERLGKRVVAEGVETWEQLDQVKQEGCTEVQGFLLSRPLAAADALAFAIADAERRAA
ncbi:EAL domain-containing protein [Methylobacterium sp. C1]|uniref:bifunctional diguanylate cyclase/phosphodiesterase n=1 Tax=Methylobacterium sp. C1 TaxID=1479019 RepID=UPI0008D91FCB|nr:EAL domain-containing protein [Methylobacterium sp. C1]